jgi:hypothetical protein
MNPRIPADYQEVAAWLGNFVRSHAKRVDERLEVLVDASGPREGRSYGVRLVLGSRVHPPLEASPLELEFREVADGRTRFAWAEALGARIRAAARETLAPASDAR